MQQRKMMPIRRKEAPPLKAVIHETRWPGDDAIDVEASDLEAWSRTGDIDALVVRQGMTPAKIRYRGLTELEMSQVPWGETGQSTMAFMQACRYGLMSITEETLTRNARHGISGLSTNTLEDLINAVAEIPLGPALKTLYEAVGISDDSLTNRTMEVSLPMWLGVHILATTFRARREDI
jgi:hypothetical protein